MQYGYFDDAQREYVITNPKTPVKWINYIGSLAFGGFVDQTGGALLCKGDPALNRITKYIPQMPASDFKGETMYLRIVDSDKYRIFSPFFVPCLQPYELYECRVGLGYCSYLSRVDGIESEITVFVPPGASLELRLVRVTNRRAQACRVDAVPVAEYTHFDALKQFTNADWVPQTMMSDMVAFEDGWTALFQYAFMKKNIAMNYFSASLPVSSFETDRARFLGDNEYGTWAHPLALDQPELSNYQARRGDNIGALLLPLGELQPGESREFVTLLGQEPDVQAAEKVIRRYADPAAARQALQELKRFWDKLLARQQVHTGIAALDSMLNIHNPRQCYITLNWSRDLSLYQLGFGGRGIGYRDSSQDAMGAMVLAPQDVHALLVKLLSVMRRDGSAVHQFYASTLEGSLGDAAERADLPKFYSDDALWVVLAVTQYVKESGDFSFLEEILPFYEKDESGKTVESGTVFAHLQRALEFTRTHTGAHGLPLLGFADWNDTINLPAGSESAFAACLYGRGLLEMAALLEYLQDEALASKYRADYESMKEIFNRAAWDGDWYISYFTDDGTPLGSRRNEAGQIFAYSQAWPVLAGFADGERAKRALQSLYERLNTPKGIKLSTPGFNGFDPRKGGVTTYPPGAKENGGIFLHVNPWVVIAELLVGNPERAYAYYAQINPAAKNDRIDEYQCEPYVYPQNILGDEHPQFGLARNSWLSGTASWMYQAATHYLLGIRPEYDGLRVDPRIPSDWEGFQVTRQFRGALYQIQVTNPLHKSGSKRQMWVDGRPVEGNLAPLFASGEHEIKVTFIE